MKGVDNWVDPLRRLIKDHKDISEYVDNAEEILGLLLDEEAWSKIKPIEDFFKQRVIEHFGFEEKIVFPAILSGCATPESIKLILELQREHGIILKELEEFLKIISENTIPLDKETNTRLNVVGREIMDSLIVHASKEDDELLPILQKNRHIFNSKDVI